MKKKIIFIILVSAITVFAGFILIKSNNNGKQDVVCVRDDCFKVELAFTPEERAQGLMFREDLKEDEGMLFIFQAEGEHPFWMKNTLIPLDIIWINKDKEIVFISESTQPCLTENCPSVNPNKMAQYVLELKGGTSKAINLSVGDKIEIRISAAKKALTEGL